MFICVAKKRKELLVFGPSVFSTSKPCSGKEVNHSRIILQSKHGHAIWTRAWHLENARRGTWAGLNLELGLLVSLPVLPLGGQGSQLLDVLLACLFLRDLSELVPGLPVAKERQKGRIKSNGR